MSEIIDFFQNYYLLLIINLCNIFGKYICVHGFDRSTDTILLRKIIIWLKIRVPVHSRWLSLLKTSTSTISCLSCIEADHAILHTNELPMFVYNLWMIYCQGPHYVNNCVQLPTLRCATISNTLMCTPHDFPSGEVRYLHTSLVIR